MSDSQGLAPVQGLRLMSMTQYPTSRSCLSTTGSSLRFLQGVGVYSKAITTLPSIDGGGAPDGRVGGVQGGSAAMPASYGKSPKGCDPVGLPTGENNASLTTH